MKVNHSVPPCPDKMSLPDRYTWDLGDIEGYDRRWREKRFPQLPFLFRMPAAREYRKRYFADGRKASNLFLLNLTNKFDYKILKLGTDEDEIKRYSEIRVRELTSLHFKSKSDDKAYDNMSWIINELGFKAPKIERNITLTGAINRVKDERWWRRQIRRKYSQLLENIAVECGMVYMPPSKRGYLPLLPASHKTAQSG